MPKKQDYIDAYGQATAASSSEPIFNLMKNSLNGTVTTTPAGGMIVKDILLDTQRPGDNTRVVEDALRSVFNDTRKERHPDVMMGKTPIEVKQTTSGFGKIPTDTYGVAQNTTKWYIYLIGDVQRTKQDRFDAWIMRSDHLYAALAPVVATFNQNMITPGPQTAVSSIASEISGMSAKLAQIINDRAQGTRVQLAPKDLSLPSRVGLNRVRFDIKFESLLRKTISEMLED
jgi:hypothetical protein